MMMNKTAVEDQKAKEEAQAYATLMRTVESLQSDLQQTIVTCRELREGKYKKNSKCHTNKKFLRLSTN